MSSSRGDNRVCDMAADAGLAQFRREYDAIIRDYMQDNVVRQDYLLTRATKL